MGMSGAVVNIKIIELGSSEFSFGEHAFHHLDEEGVLTAFHSLAKALLHKVGRCEHSLTAGIAGIAEIFTFLHLAVAHLHLVGIDDDYVVAAIHVGGEIGFILATKYFCYLRAKTAENLVGGVYNKIFLLDVVFCY